MQCERKGDSLILRPYAPIKFIGVFTTGFVCVGIYLILMLFRKEDGSFSAASFELADWFGVGFLVIWTSVAGWMSYVTLYSKLRYRLVLDRNGIHELGVPFRRSQRTLRWSEVRDYGYYFMGNFDSGGKRVGMYTLYFSPEPLEIKNDFRKKANKGMIRLDIAEHFLQEVAEDTVFPFCRQYRSFPPQTVEITNHFM